MSFPVLICDDSNMARRMVQRSLPCDWDVEIFTAENGQQALDILQQQHIALLFLDLTMPEMDGLEVLQAVKDQGIETYVLVISGDIQPQMRQRVMALGALDFISKPVDSLRIYQILERYGFYSYSELASA